METEDSFEEVADMEEEHVKDLVLNFTTDERGNATVETSKINGKLYAVILNIDNKDMKFPIININITIPEYDIQIFNKYGITKSSYFSVTTIPYDYNGVDVNQYPLEKFYLNDTLRVEVNSMANIPIKVILRHK